jgi:hypothetical protein
MSKKITRVGSYSLQNKCNKDDCNYLHLPKLDNDDINYDEIMMSNNTVKVILDSLKEAFINYDKESPYIKLKSNICRYHFTCKCKHSDDECKDKYKYYHIPKIDDDNFDIDVIKNDQPLINSLIDTLIELHKIHYEFLKSQSQLSSSTNSYNNYQSNEFLDPLINVLIDVINIKGKGKGKGKGNNVNQNTFTNGNKGKGKGKGKNDGKGKGKSKGKNDILD